MQKDIQFIQCIKLYDRMLRMFYIEKKLQLNNYISLYEENIIFTGKFAYLTKKYIEKQIDPTHRKVT